MPKARRWLVLAAIAVLDTLRPVAAAPLAIHIHSERAMFQVLISPGTVGTDSFVLQLMSGDGNLLAVREATMVLSLSGRGIDRSSARHRPAPTAIGMSTTCRSHSPAAGTSGSMP